MRSFIADSYKRTDVVIGMVTDGTSNVEALTGVIAAGMETYFPQYSWSTIHAFVGRSASAVSSANTLSIQIPQFGLHHMTYPWHGIAEKSNGYRVILEAAQRMQSSICLIVDPAQEGFEGNWLDALIRPGIHSHYDLVTPIYRGSARDQLMSRNLMSPMLRTLFGRGPKQPMSGEFLLSARLINRLLSRHDWESTPARLTPELWISFVAAAENYKLAESAVGASKLRATKPKLSQQAALGQIVGSLFILMDQYESRWSGAMQFTDLDRFGQSEPESRASKKADGLEYLVRFVESYPVLREAWKSILDPHTFRELDELQESLRLSTTDRYLGGALWVRLVFELAAAWKHRLVPRSQLLGLFTPLYLARAGSFLLKTQWMEEAEVESEFANLVEYFEALRSVLQRLWNCDAEEGPNNQSPARIGAEAA
ncbi:MAG: hypothetical protein ABI823_06040 [Bryobacteraceae bacterium]